MYKEIRKLIRMIILENSKLIGEPDATVEKHRDDPKPQYEDEKDSDDQTNDEASTVAGIGSGLGPNMPIEYDPEKPVYDPYKRKNNK